jgi:hypothetical protein
MRTAPARLALALACGLIPAALQGQDPRLASRLSAGTAQAVQELADSARAAGLPHEPLILKALEGASKGADSARIVTAVRALVERLQEAARALGPAATEAELVAGAAALRAGVQPNRLSSLKSLRPREQVTVPLSVLADLFTAGVTPDRAWSSVRDMASRGATDADYLALRDRLVPPGASGPTRLPPAAEYPPAPARPKSDHQDR